MILRVVDDEPDELRVQASRDADVSIHAFRSQPPGADLDVNPFASSPLGQLCQARLVERVKWEVIADLQQGETELESFVEQAMFAQWPRRFVAGHADCPTPRVAADAQLHRRCHSQ